MATTITAYFTAEGITPEVICNAIEQEHNGPLYNVQFGGVRNLISHGRTYAVDGDTLEVMILIGRLAAMGYGNIVRID